MNLEIDDAELERIAAAIITAALIIYDKDDDMSPKEIADSAWKHAAALTEARKRNTTND